MRSRFKKTLAGVKESQLNTNPQSQPVFFLAHPHNPGLYDGSLLNRLPFIPPTANKFLQLFGEIKETNELIAINSGKNFDTMKKRVSGMNPLQNNNK